MKKLSYLVLLLPLLARICAAELPIPLSDYSVKRWDSSDGLPHNSINGLVQTGDGYLWLATWEGLARYNGVSFDLFGRGEVTGLPSSAIRSASVEVDGAMFVASARGGVSRYHQGRWQALTPAAGQVRHMLRTRDGDLWLAVEGKGLYRRSADQPDVDQLVLPNVLGHKLVEDNQGRLWLAADQGLFQLDGGVIQRFGAEHGLPQGTVYDLLLQPDGQLLVATTQGVWVERQEHFAPLSPALADKSVSSLLRDSQGNLWFGTIKSGLYRLSERGLEHLGPEQGIPDTRVLALLQGREKNIWVGTNAGLIRVKNALFSNWTEQRGLNGNYIRTVLSHSDGSIWTGSSRGLSRIEKDQAQPISLPAPLTTLSVLSLTEGPDGSVWIGTYSQGLFRWNAGTLKQVETVASGLSSNEIRALLFDDQGTLWMGTPLGVTLRQANGRLRRLDMADGLSDEFIWVLERDDQGRIWAGTNNTASWFSEGRFHNLDLSELDDVEKVFGLLFQPGYLWLSTERGLVRYRFVDQQQRLISQDDGLPSDTVFQTVADRQGGLWLTSSRGVIRVSLAGLNRYIDHQEERLDIDVFDESDGLATAQINGASSPSAVMDKQGWIWVATAMGAARVQPERELGQETAYFPVWIEALRVDDQPQPLSASLSLAPDSDRLTVSYAGLNYSDPGHIRYRTLLEGFDSHWVERGNQRRVEYTNLPPGDYRLRIQAGYPSLYWGLNEVSVYIIQQPYFWQRTWFRVLVLLLVAGLVALVSKWRVYRLQQIEVKLNERVAHQTQALRRQAAAFERQAREDALTGLPNRRAFDETFAAQFRHAGQQHSTLVLAILDIDHFKRINDRWSHLVGDEAICAVADLLQGQLQSGWLLARWGGEEFTLVLPETDLAAALEQCERLRLSIAQHPQITSVPGLQLTISIGLVDNRAANSYARMLSQADMALYQAKQQGRNRVEAWSEAMDALPSEGDGVLQATEILA